MAMSSIIKGCFRPYFLPFESTLSKTVLVVNAKAVTILQQVRVGGIAARVKKDLKGPSPVVPAVFI